MTRTDKASTHTFYGPDDVWKRYKAICPLKLEGKPASKRVAELVERDLQELEGAPAPDKTEKNIAELQTRLQDLAAEGQKIRKLLQQNHKQEFSSLSKFFINDPEYGMFPDGAKGGIVNGRMQLAKFIQDNPRPDISREVRHLVIRLLETRIEGQELMSKLEELQRSKYNGETSGASSVGHVEKRRQQPHPKRCLECGHFPDNISSALYYETEKDKLLSRLGPEKFAELTPENVGLGITVRCGAGFTTNANGRTGACSRAIPKAAGEAISTVPPEMLEK